MTTTGEAYDNYYCECIYVFKYKRSANSKIGFKYTTKNDKIYYTVTAAFKSKADLVKKINSAYRSNSAEIKKNGKILMKIRKLDSTAKFALKKAKGMKVA